MSEPWEYGETAGSETAGSETTGSETTGSETAGSETAGSETARASFPWPPAEDESPLAAFGETWKSATFEPAAFYRRVPRRGGTGAALVYYLALVLVVAGATLFWESLSLFAVPLDESGLSAGAGLGAVSPVVGFLLTPIILLGMLFVSAGITHALLRLFGGGRHGFGTSVRVFCFAYSPGLFGVIPLIGGLVGSVWMIVLLITGLREAHETDGWKAALAVLLPFLLLLGMVVLAFLVLLTAGAAVLGG